MQTNTIQIEETHALAKSALALATYLMAALSDAQQNTVIHGLKSGASLVLEIGPFPDVNRFQLVLVEREGKRSNLAGLKK